MELFSLVVVSFLVLGSGFVERLKFGYAIE